MSLRVSPRRVSVLACTALLGCLPVAFASAQASPPSTLALRVGDSTAATQHGTGAFTDLTVTVSQTEHLRNQVVTVSWTGGTPTSANGFRSDYLQIMQCWGDEAAPVREKCQFGADWQSLDQYSGNTKRRTIQNLATISDPNEEIVPELGQSQYIPFQGVGGTIVTDPNKNDLFNIYDTNELAYSRTAADGTGTAFFEVQTQAQSAGPGSGSETPPRAASLTSRFSSSSRRIANIGSALPSSIDFWTPAYDSLARDCTSARSTLTSVPSPPLSTSIVHSRAGRTWSGRREPAPSEITFGCRGIFESAPYRVSPRRLASTSIGSPGVMKAARSAIA